MSFLSSFNFDVFNDSKEKALAYPLGSLFFSLDKITQKNKHVFIITEDNPQANKVFESLSSIYSNVIYFPSIEVMPYSHGIPSLDILTTRIQTMSLLHQNNQPYIIV